MSGRNHHIKFDLVVPESDGDRIVARLNRFVILGDATGPSAALPHPNAKSTYKINWKESSIVARCVHKGEGRILLRRS
jgi:hypothetical protein